MSEMIGKHEISFWLHLIFDKGQRGSSGVQKFALCTAHLPILISGPSYNSPAPQGVAPKQQPKRNLSCDTECVSGVWLIAEYE